MTIRFWPALLAFLPFLASAENSKPSVQPKVDPIPEARDVEWPGVIEILVDATDVTRGIFNVTEKIPVTTSGRLTLLYPKWIPGNHSDSGEINLLAGLKVSASGKPLPWKRDAMDVFAFHVEVPDGAKEVTAQFQFLSPGDASQGRIVTTPEMLNLQWWSVALYPAGHFVRQITVSPSVKYPAEWQAATALEPSAKEGDVVRYKNVSFETLVDSPIFAGRHMRVESLAPDVRLNIVADDPDHLAATEEQIEAHRKLVQQALKLFGSPHYEHYDFLLALSARQGKIGLEHHQSSENGPLPTYFTEWTNSVNWRELLPHEFVHSWNGKFRRPANLWTPDYRTPMQDNLLWVYEGQTEFWGLVLGARSGILTKEETLEGFAHFAAICENSVGRKWRPLEDTTYDPVVARRQPLGWRSWQRAEDYYLEGLLIWLDADTLIRELSRGDRSLDDFAKRFFGMRSRDWGELTYTFDDVVRTLNEVQAHDWAQFFKRRVEEINVHAPVDGLARGGYRLIYTDTPTAWFKAHEKEREITDLSFSAGIILGKDGEVKEVIWDGPAFQAGLTAGSKIVAVNSRALDTDQLKSEIKAKKSPLKLLVKTGDLFRTIELNYEGGLRYPRLEKSGSATATIDTLLKPRE